MNIKRFLTLALALTLVLVLTLLPVQAEAATVASGTWYNLSWELKDNTLTITGSGEMFDGYGEGSCVDYPWYNYGNQIHKIVVGNKVTSIGTDAFAHMGNLTQVTIGNSVAIIRHYSFRNCSSLETITIPASVTNIGYKTFMNCANLKNVSFASGSKLRYISKEAFMDCKNLQLLELPDALTHIDEFAFNGCSSLKSVTFGSKLETIGRAAFSSCTQLQKVKFPASLRTIEDHAFINCHALTSVTLPDGLKTLGECAFYNCKQLTGSIKIPSTVTTGGAEIFRHTNLQEVTVNCAWSIFAYAFADCSQLKTLTIGDSVTGIGMGAFLNNTALTEVSLPSSVTFIGDSAFQSCKNLTNIIIPTSVTVIGKYAFDGCDSLTSVCYNGTCKQWNNISIEEHNDDLTNASIHFNENGDHNCDTCGRVLSKCEDKNKDDKCDICGKNIPIPVPAKPYKIANVVSGVHVYWKATQGAVKYGLWRSETGKNGTYKWVANPTVPHFTDTKVESGKTYYYKVTTMNANGQHSEKSEAIGIVYVGTPDITSRFNKAAGITLGWNKIQGATGYAIYRKSYSGTDAWVRIATIEGNQTFTWQDTSVKNNNGSAYKYTIRALAGADMKTLSGCRNAGRSMVRLTSRTLNSAVKASATSIKCTWTTSAVVTGYEVRFMVGSTVYKTFTVGNYKTGVKTFTGLKAGQTYKIQVRSYVKIDGMGFYSAWSEAKSVKLP